MSSFEFHAAYSINGTYLYDYVPYVEHGAEHDILIDGIPLADSDWSALTGLTGQYGYRGAVMHPSENLSDEALLLNLAELDASMFAIVGVEAPCTELEPCFEDEPEYCRDYGCSADPAGWAVIYKAREVAE